MAQPLREFGAPARCVRPHIGAGLLVLPRGSMFVDRRRGGFAWRVVGPAPRVTQRALALVLSAQSVRRGFLVGHRALHFMIGDALSAAGGEPGPWATNGGTLPFRPLSVPPLRRTRRIRYGHPARA